MNFTAIVSLLAGVLLVFVPFIKWFVRRRKYENLVNAIPGPATYPLIGTTYQFWGVARKDLFSLFERAKIGFPGIMRRWFGPLAVVEINKAEYVEKLLASNKHHLGKAWYYKYIKQWLGDGLLISNGEKWHKHRKIITPTFHFTILEGFCEIFSEKSRVMVQKLAANADTGKPVNVYPYITKAALDIIADAAMGMQLNAQDDEGADYVRAVYETTESIIYRMLRPYLIPEFVYTRTKAGQAFTAQLAILHEFTRNVIKQRREKQKSPSEQLQQIDKEDEFTGKKKRLAFLDLLLASDGLSDNDIREEVDTFMFEGHDTTTTGIAWALLLLGLHQDVQDQVYAELEEIFQGSDRHATVQDLNEMKVLERVIKETLRLFPPVPIIGRVASEDITFDQYTVPAGCNINISIYTLHRDKRFFPDPERFDPDRFLPENTVNRHPFAFAPFSGGPRNCIGQKFAMYEEKALLSELLRSYRFRTVGSLSDIGRVFEVVLRPIDGIQMTLEKRLK